MVSKRITFSKARLLPIALLVIALSYGALWVTQRVSHPLPTIQNATPKVEYEDIVVGTGPPTSVGSQVTVHFVLKLRDTGAVLADTHKQPGHLPTTLTIGKQQLLTGIEMAIDGMQVGGLRRAIIPPALGYGSKGVAPNIPADAVLICDIELVAVAPAASRK